VNDLEVNEHCVALRNLARRLCELQAGPSELALFIALSDIEKHARNAQDRLNSLKPKPPLYLPSRGAVSG